MTDHSTVFRGGRVVGADGSFDADVLVVGERIAAVGQIEDNGATVVDASGCLLLPGLIDNHTHLTMPFMGTWSSDDYDTGTQAAAAGGTTCLVDFAIQQEPESLRSALDQWHGRADGAAHVDYGFHMAISAATPAAIDDMEAMVEAGVTSFKLFMAYKGALMVRDDEMAAVMERARDLGALTMVHAENGDLVDLYVSRALAAGDTSAINHALTRPEMVEAEATDRAARIAEAIGTPLFVVHVTCAAAAAEIEAAQQRGAPVTGETCTQYLVNTIDDLRKPGVQGCRYICSPPLRDAANHAPLWDYLERGVSRASRPTTARSTTSRSRAAWTTSRSSPTACRSSSTAWPSCGTKASCAGHITPEQLVDRTSTTVARRFGLTDKGSITPGQARRHRRLRPQRAQAVRHGDVVHERRLRPLRGRDGERVGAPDVLPRDARLRPGRDPHVARSRPLRRAGDDRGRTPSPHDGGAVDRRRQRPGRPRRAGDGQRRTARGRQAPGVVSRTGATRGRGCAASWTSCRG